VKLSNRHFTILGEITKPGVHYFYNEKSTLLEAISIAGGFTDFSNRKKVKLIRKKDNGTVSVYLNLFRSDFMYSEYNYVHPHDIIYIEPTKSKSRNLSANMAGVVVSAISVGVLFISLFVRNNSN